MKKRRKTLASIFTAAALVLTMALPAMALTTENTYTANTTNGKLTPTVNDAGNYEASVDYKKTDSTGSEPDPGTGEIVITLPDGKAAHNQDFEYKVYRIFDSSTSGTATNYTLLDGTYSTDTSGTITPYGLPSQEISGTYTTTNSGGEEEQVATTYRFNYENGNVVMEYNAGLDTSGNTIWNTVTSAQTPNDTAAFNASLAAAIEEYMSDVKASNSSMVFELMDVTITDNTLNSSTNAYTSKTYLTLDTLPFGYYYITTTTGSLVTINTTTPTVSVTDKNTVNPPKKEITGISNDQNSEGTEDDADRYAYSVSYTQDEAGNKVATVGTAQIGDKIGYTGTIKVGKGATNYTYKDLMSVGLTPVDIDAETHTGITITYKKSDGTTGTISETEIVNSETRTNYTVSYEGDFSGDEIGDNDTYTFSVHFNDDLLDELGEDTEIYIAYSAILNDNADMGTTGNINESWLSYGNTPSGGSEPETPHTDTHTYTGKITLTKDEGDGTTGSDGTYTPGTAVPNAEFLLMNTTKTKTTTNDDGTTTVTVDDTGTESPEYGKYYKWTLVDSTTGEYEVTWVDDAADATLFVSNSDGDVVGILTDQATIDSTYRNNDGTIKWTELNANGITTIPAFQGLAAGKYTLKEVKTPAGYNKIADTVIKIQKVESTTVGQSETSEEWQKIYVTSNIVNRKGSIFPGTGGIGTKIFYISGTILVIGACVLLITRRRARKDS